MAIIAKLMRLPKEIMVMSVIKETGGDYKRSGTSPL